MRALVAVLVVLLCSSCSGSPSPSSRATPVVARVRGTAVTDQLFQVRLHSTLTALAQAGGPTGNAAMTARVRASVLRSLLLDTVIAQEAAAAGVAATDAEVQAQVDADAQAAGGTSQLQAQLAALGGSLAQLRDEVRSSLNESKLEDLLARQRAAAVEQQLAAGASFATLATQYSDDTATSGKGGELGPVARTTVEGDDPAYAAAVLALQPGRHTDPPIHDAQGYDIVALDSATASTLTLRHILLAAPQPYTVRERPGWFAEAIFEALAQDCAAGQIHIYVTDVGDDPCAAAASPSP